ncbi:MAG: chromate resistance protein ChrB domain-containing protein [Parvibaculaceae bacterium]
MGDFFVSPEHLMAKLARAQAPRLVDVRRRSAFDGADRLLPAAVWRDHLEVSRWAKELPSGGALVIYCTHGHNVSQLAAAALRAEGLDARVLAGGIEAWIANGYPTVGRAPFHDPASQEPSRWVTRVKPKIDRIACPWFIRRFVDSHARILFVEPEFVLDVAAEADAVAFDVKGAPIEHEGERCSFDTFLDRFAIEDAALRRLARIVRGADTARPDLEPEAAGLLAASLGISAMSSGDEEALDRGFRLYDALYAWLTLASGETHNWAGKVAP